MKAPSPDEAGPKRPAPSAADSSRPGNRPAPSYSTPFPRVNAGTGAPNSAADRSSPTAVTGAPGDRQAPAPRPSSSKRLAPTGAPTYATPFPTREPAKRDGAGPGGPTAGRPTAGNAKPFPRGDDLPTPAPARDKSPNPPSGYRRPGGQFAEPFPVKGDDSGPGRDWRPPRGRPSHVSHPAWDGRPRRNRFRYHHYYYRVYPRYYVYGGWGPDWYDPWWYGNYWWPQTNYNVYHTYHYYHYYDDVRPRDWAPYYDSAPWMDSELQTALADIAVAWTTGDIELFQAHLTPGAAIAIRHNWQQREPWVLAAPVLLDILLEAVDAQADGQFRFVQTEEMEPGLVWAVGEHSFRLEGEPREQATMEFMFREYEGAWIVEAITASPEKYWWLDGDLLDDAARESARLFEEMDRAQVWGPG